MLWVTLYGKGQLAKVHAQTMKLVKTYPLPGGNAGAHSVLVPPLEGLHQLIAKMRRIYLVCHRASIPCFYGKLTPGGTYRLISVPSRRYSS